MAKQANDDLVVTSRAIREDASTAQTPAACRKLRSDSYIASTSWRWLRRVTGLGPKLPGSIDAGGLVDNGRRFKTPLYPSSTYSFTKNGAALFDLAFQFSLALDRALFSCIRRSWSWLGSGSVSGSKVYTPIILNLISCLYSVCFQIGKHTGAFKAYMCCLG
jgi:hypothetical protein